MKAVAASEYGKPEVLTAMELPAPEPGAGQVLVRVAAAGLNPADLRLLSGVMGDAAPLAFPHVPGIDVAGTVVGIGAGVVDFAPGDEVFGFGLPVAAAEVARAVSTPPPLSTGAMAEYAVLATDAPALALRPAALPVDHAATLATAGLTALPLMRAGGFAPGEVVLVVGAAGGVGGAVVPILAAAGVYVIATAIDDDADYVRALGAAEVIDRRSGDLAGEVLRRYPGGVDALVNLAMSGPALVAASRAVRPHGQLLNIAFPSPDPAAFGDLRVETIYTTARPGDLDELAARAVAGELPSTVSRRYELERAAEAYVDLERDHVRGKFVVVM